MIRGTARERSRAGPSPRDSHDQLDQAGPWRGGARRSRCSTRGAAFDPTSGERVASSEGLEAARDYLGFPFPALKGSPLLEARVCQYENTDDQHFIVDRHPGAGNVWLVGGGSGHGFKHGPALGELVAADVLGEKPTELSFSLARFRPRT